jgi:NADH-ubiquinone oxidoreductase chain 6
MINIIEIVIIPLAIFTIITRNPVNAVISLISVFILSGLYLTILSLNFIGMSYIIIYVGAIAILLLFVVMMINVKYIELSRDSIETSSSLLLTFIIIGGLIFGLLPKIYDSWSGIINKSLYIYTSGEISWDNYILTESSIIAMGNNLYTNFGTWLMLISIILLLAMIGPIILTENNKGYNKSSY